MTDTDHRCPIFGQIGQRCQLGDGHDGEHEAEVHTAWPRYADELTNWTTPPAELISCGLCGTDRSPETLVLIDHILACRCTPDLHVRQDRDHWPPKGAR